MLVRSKREVYYDLGQQRTAGGTWRWIPLPMWGGAADLM